MVYITNDLILDCYDDNQIGECWASSANSSFQLFDSRPDLINQNPSRSNAKIVVRQKQRKEYLVATRDIIRDQEILVSYGKKYRFPSH